MDFSDLLAAVDFGGVDLAVLAVAALMVVPMVVKRGADMVLSMLGRPDTDGYYRGDDGNVYHVDD